MARKAQAIIFPVLEGGVLRSPQRARKVPGPVLLQSNSGDEDKKPLVLIAEDNDLQRNILRIFLEREQFQVMTCRDGERALHFCQVAGPIDLLISDVHMPHLEGDRLAAAVSRQRPAMPLILMSSEPLSLRSQMLLAGRRWTFLQKPYSLPSMLALVREKLTRQVPQETATPSPFQPGPPAKCAFANVQWSSAS